MHEDALAKVGLKSLLAPHVPLLIQHEVQAPAQFADLYVAGRRRIRRRWSACWARSGG